MMLERPWVYVRRWRREARDFAVLQAWARCDETFWRVHVAGTHREIADG